MPQQRGMVDGGLGCSWGHTLSWEKGWGVVSQEGPCKGPRSCGAQDKKVRGAWRTDPEKEMSGGIKHTGFV